MVSLRPAQPFQRKAVLSFMTGYLHMRKFAPEIIQEQILPPKVVITIHITAPAASLGPGNLWYHRAHKSVFYTGLRISSTGAAAFIISVWLCFLFFAFHNNCKFFSEMMPTLWLWGEAVSSRVGPEWATMERRLLLTLGRKTIGWFSQGGAFLSEPRYFYPLFLIFVFRSGNSSYENFHENLLSFQCTCGWTINRNVECTIKAKYTTFRILHNEGMSKFHGHYYIGGNPSLEEVVTRWLAALPW